MVGIGVKLVNLLLGIVGGKEVNIYWVLLYIVIGLGVFRKFLYEYKCCVGCGGLVLFLYGEVLV